ncbi:serine/arginine-rich SC35-like splicing factor SCL30A isoform X3 [Cryptomeria japonica]|uniref:serine/arginine-rich SC35-like splicing factor SCL30A isoform X3 n=1 Tax=Cryptomeria japonica TaxID=3369 RepID=UPI0027DA409E|nr:serine/arginine-rich SC35-like splicing factor SCL30A isoform X3 [Cryptomeria japonica]
MKSSGHPKLKRRTPSPPPSSRRERERGEHSERRHAEEDANAFPTTLLVRNLSHETRSEDIYNAFEGFGLVNDVYIPTNYHTRYMTDKGFIIFTLKSAAGIVKTLG